jgi:peptide/nickel transport system substrate-binding protein/oligopeptide transport system substrate-binding protein
MSGEGTLWTFALRKAPDHEDNAGFLGELFVQHVRRILLADENPLQAQLADLVAGADEFRKGRSEEIIGITLENDLLSISLTRPYRQFYLWLSQPGMCVLKSYTLSNASGYGPFTVSELNNGSQQTESGTTSETSNFSELILKPNPVSLDDQPVLDELRFICEPDRNNQIELFRKGELDAANVSVNRISAVSNDPELSQSAVRHETAVPLLGVFDHHEFPWGEQEFRSKVGLRRAANLALNQAMIAELADYVFEPYPHLLPPYYEDFIDPSSLQRPLFPLGEQLEEARAALKEADHEQGGHLIPNMDLAYYVHEDLDILAREILLYWRDCSIKMRPLPHTTDEMRKRIDLGSHEIILSLVHPAYDDPDAVFYPLLHSSLYGHGGNWSMLSDKDLDAVIEQAQALSSSTNDLERKKIYRDLSRKLEERAVFVFLGYYTPTLLICDEIAGYRLTAFDFDASLAAQDFTKLGKASR